jgi:hypothetical protein
METYIVTIRKNFNQTVCTAMILTININMDQYYNDSMNEYNNPSFATMFQRALLNTCITTSFGLNPSHHQVLSYTEY